VRQNEERCIVTGVVGELLQNFPLQIGQRAFLETHASDHDSMVAIVTCCDVVFFSAPSRK